VNSILNLLMFGCTPARMRQGMRAAIRAAARVPGIQEIGAWNFGGQFGRHRYFLHELLGDS
jgi:formylmethanofuran:tetrahydromethanopterin formyltransferase